MFAPPNLTIALYCKADSPQRHSYAQLLAEQLHISLLQQAADEFPYLLVVSDDRLELQPMHSKATPIYVDFLSAAYQYRRLTGGKKHELIAKAVGIKGREKPTIIDATAGLGQDGFVLASLGCVVHCLERSPIIAALLQDGINRLKEKLASTLDFQAIPPIHSPALSLTLIDAREYLKQLTESDYPEVIYLDPMFPARRKCALAKKQLRVLRDIVGDDLDTAALLALALLRAKKRVVVKRPRLAPAIAGKAPDLVFNGQSSRFDVYLVGVKT